MAENFPNLAKEKPVDSRNWENPKQDKHTHTHTHTHHHHHHHQDSIIKSLKNLKASSGKKNTLQAQEQR